MIGTTYHTTLPHLVPSVTILRLAVEANRRAHGEAALKAELAWTAYDKALDAGDPNACLLGNLAVSYDRQRMEAWTLMDAAEAELLAGLQ